MEFLERDKGDEAKSGEEENEEPRANRIDVWARSAVPTLAPDEEYFIEKETEEKRKQRAQNFIEDRHVKGEVFRQSLKRITTAASTARYTNFSWDDFRPQTAAQVSEGSKKIFRLEQPEPTMSLETKKYFDDLRARKAMEVKETRDIAKKKKEEKEKTEVEEKKRQKLQHELKNKPYTYSVRGKITFLTKDKKKLPEPPVPRTSWKTSEDRPLSPHYENIHLQSDSSNVASEHRKNYKELRTGEMPESVTITLAPNNKVIKVSFWIRVACEWGDFDGERKGDRGTSRVLYDEPQRVQGHDHYKRCKGA
eukprot:TRINITY_DN12433_c0_g2_i7.p1 TRINITY_DN12433_c0_g2~~TRINITY_DN12433_c0_g2_i7.p1  ORF type:complete len:308 (+),score=90.80 TRINITY_DN12433_c0_g2_i7:471-1394(+)